MTRQNYIRKYTQKLIRLFNENSIKYWLDFGTLLGAVREHDIIEWDTDADLSIMQEEINKVRTVIPIIEGWLDVTYTNINEFNRYKVFNIDGSKFHIDIYVWKRCGPHYRNIEKNWGTGGLNVFSANELEAGFTTIQFLGEPAIIPVNYHQRLTRLYGDYTIPKKVKNEKGFWDEEASEDYLRRNKLI